MSPREIEVVLGSLEDAVRRGRKPLALARPVLLALGRVLEEEGAEPAAPWVERARLAGAAIDPEWSGALREELSLACAEFAKCVDPAFLALPNYDLRYTQRARQRLGDRLRAARALGIELPGRESDMLELADRVLAAFLERRGTAGGTTAPTIEDLDRPDPTDRSSHKTSRK